MTQLTLKEMGRVTGVSPAYLGRIEQGKRFPSARVLHKIAKHMGFHDYQLFTLAGYLSAESSVVVDSEARPNTGRLDPHVARVLASEPPAVQSTVIGILDLLKFLAKRERP